MNQPTVTYEADNSNLQPFEAAARIYCAKVNMDPDHVMQAPHPSLVGVIVDTPFWHIVAEKMIDTSRMLTSMREAAEAAQSAANDGPHKPGHA